MTYRVAYQNGKLLYCVKMPQLTELDIGIIFTDVIAESKEQAIEIAKEMLRKAGKAVEE